MAAVIYSTAVEELRGKAGSDVFVHGRSGSYLRPRKKGRNPKTAAQTGSRNNLGKGSASWKSLTAAQVLAWRNYAVTITKHNQKTGRAYTPTGFNVYNGLAAKFFQVNPTGSLPTAPPASAFAGDGITVTATGGTGQVSFTGSAANGTNIKTELLLQRLVSANRLPQAKGYRTKQFVGFTSGGLSSIVSVPAGYYVPAYRFVNTLTGQEVGLTVLPGVQVS